MMLDEFAARIDAQDSFFDDAEMDGLLEYQPCICTL
jgi:hypothetical protein